MRVHYVMHASFETPGCIADWAAAQGHGFTGTHTYERQRLPDPARVDFLILMGGPQSPLQMDNAPYLRDEIKLISDVLEQNKPIVGFCLGAQLIAEALGATTQRSPEKEVGVFPVHMTLEGIVDPLMKEFVPRFDALHWHLDMPGLPDEAVLLARSAGCPHQAFRFRDRVYGFQFHMEPTRDSIELLMTNAVSDMAPSKYTQTIEQIRASDFATMNRRLLGFLNSLVALAGS